MQDVDIFKLAPNTFAKCAFRVNYIQLLEICK